MSADHERASDRLDVLLRDARAVEIDDGPDDDALVARAVLAGRARHEARARRSRWAVVGGSLAVAATVLLAWLVPSSDGERAAGEIVELTLPAGDRLAATGDARFDVVSSVESHRVVRLRRGAMLFDVAPLGSGSSFEVETPDARVRVLGTVFAVDVGERGTSVRVYEGRVEVERERGGRVVMRPGESDGRSVGSGRLALLDERGRAAAALRALRASAPSEAHEPEVAALEVAAVAAPDVAAPQPRGSDVASLRPRRSRIETSVAEAQTAPTLAEVRELLTAGRAEEALATAHEHASEDAAWRLLEADALRGLGRAAEAADAYEDAASRLDGVAARAPAFLAAELRMRRLHDPTGALRVIDETGVDAVDSPLRERGLALRADALDQLGRTHELARVAEIYLAALPDGPRADWMRAHVDALH